MFLTPLLIHHKTPVTTRTAGRCDWPEAPPATPVFILLFLSSPGSLPETWKSAHGSVPHRCGESLVLSCHLRRKANAGVSCLDLSPHSPDKGRRRLFVGTRMPPRPSPPDTAAHKGKRGRNCWGLNGRGKWLHDFFVNAIAIPVTGKATVPFSALRPSGRKKWVWALARKTCLAACGKPNALLAPPVGG